MLLVAAPGLLDPNFRRTVVYLIEHRERGSLGVVLNRHTTSQGAYSGGRYQTYETYGSAAGEPKADSAA